MKKITLLFLFFGLSAFAQFPEGFEGATFPPTGWSSFIGTNGIGTLQNWTRNTVATEVGAGTASAKIRYENVTGIAEDWLVTPPVAITAANANLTFIERQQYTAAYNSTYSIKVSTTSATDIASFTNVLTYTEAGLGITAFTPRAVDLTAYVGQTVYVAFVMANDDGDNWNIDTVNFSAVPSCNVPSAGTAVIGAGATSATLSWVTGGPANYEIKVQAAGAGVPAIVDGTGVDVIGATTYAATSLTAATAYEFYVRSECTPAFEYSTWAGPFLFTTNLPPLCSTQVSPANAATNVPLVNTATIANGVALAWTAPTSGSVPTGYKIRWGASPATLAVLGTTPNLGVTITGLSYNTTYYWQAQSTNTAGDAAGCEVFSLTTGPSPGFCLNGELYPTATYTPLVLNGTTANQINANAFAGEYANVNVVSGTTYIFESSVDTDFVTIGNTDGSVALAFGVTPLTWTSNVTGVIRYYIHVDNQCGSENVDRTRSITGGGALATNTFDASKLSVYPNPVLDALNISYDKSITEVTVTNLLGQVVLSKLNLGKEAKIDMTSLQAGSYIVKLSSDKEVNSIKVIKN
jgi:Secretion system C-terminal sorting domain